MYIVLHEEYSLFLSDFYETKFLERFSKNSEKSNVVKIRPVGAELFYADSLTERQTDRQVGANSRFPQFR